MDEQSGRIKWPWDYVGEFGIVTKQWWHCGEGVEGLAMEGGATVVVRLKIWEVGRRMRKQCVREALRIFFFLSFLSIFNKNNDLDIFVTENILTWIK